MDIPSKKIIHKITKKFKNLPISKIFNNNITVRNNKNSKIQLNNIINEIPPEGIIINKPGIYTFGKNISWIPKTTISAIKIESNNVILNLSNFTLTCINPLNLQTSGISVLNSSNISIKNGTISQMDLRGIECELCKDVSIENIIVDIITADNIAEYIVPVGIFFNKCENVIANKSIVRNITVRADSMAGIQITDTINSEIVNCTLTDFINLDGACTGFGHLACDSSIVKNCVVNNFQSFFNGNVKTQGHTCIGYVPIFSTNLIFENCKASNIVGCCDDAHGISIFLCLENIKVKSCIVNNVKDGVGTNTGAKATGIEVYASGVIVSDCIVNNISAINPQDKQCTGFSCAFAEDVKFLNCKASNVQVYDENGNQNSCIGYGTGFGWAPDPRPEFIFPSKNILYENCCANNCQVGFDSWYHIDSVWKKICACCCGISVLNLNNSQRTISCNACSECNPPIVITLTNVAKGNKFINVKATYC